MRSRPADASPFALALCSRRSRPTCSGEPGASDRPGTGKKVERGLRSEVEDRWREAYRRAGSGELEALEAADPELVAQDGATLAEGLKRVISRLPEGGRALAVGHSPTNEAAVYGLTGERIAPIGKGEGVLVVAEGERYRVDPLG